MKRILLLSLLAYISLAGCAQNGGDSKAGTSFVQGFKEWRNSIKNDYQEFRRQILKDYIEAVRGNWNEEEDTAPIPVPEDDLRPPVVAPIHKEPKPIKNKPVPIEEVIVPVVKEEPQPQPVTPIEEVPVDNTKYVDFVFFGTKARVRFDINDRVDIQKITPHHIANALTSMSRGAYDNLIIDCLNLRTKHKLSDWAYLQMLKAMAETVYGKNTNEAELLMAYVYVQSGYKMRLAHDGSDLYMLYSSKHLIYNLGAFEIDGDRFYCLKQMPQRLNICKAIFPKEQSLSLYINNAVELEQKTSELRTVCSRDYPDVCISMNVNKNLIDFYNTYPTSVLGENICSRWAMYANTPMAKDVADQLYPQLHSMIEGKSQLNAANILLNWVQTGFVYEYDNKVWGHDRAFFSEESLYYPYCDCEDRSILFTRLVRDLLGLNCILVLYPEHLATAVGFTDSVNGDYIEYKGQRFVVSDPTYIGAPVGMTMPDMNNQTAKVILLQ